MSSNRAKDESDEAESNASASIQRVTSASGSERHLRTNPAVQRPPSPAPQPISEVQQGAKPVRIDDADVPQAFDLWEVDNSDIEPAPLKANPTVAQIRQHADERTKRHKAISCIQNCVSDVIFTRIMACETPKQAWDKLKEEFQDTERTRQQQLLNLRREFENLKMKEEETVKKYSDRIMAIVIA
ncbi:uncharacterized protein LOC108466418 [Gossypium arboreum]|uniref:uncharacterized protein LOC108466418 n=1 Tax=Gossypium arboreum TaxID=29729 RepID=UPI00081903A5|nr:uncharacterized protein LOC108466418 [Gossypium arboreum]